MEQLALEQLNQQMEEAIAWSEEIDRNDESIQEKTLYDQAIESLNAWDDRVTMICKNAVITTDYLTLHLETVPENERGVFTPLKTKTDAMLRGLSELMDTVEKFQREYGLMVEMGDGMPASAFGKIHYFWFLRRLSSEIETISSKCSQELVEVLYPFVGSVRKIISRMLYQVYARMNTQLFFLLSYNNHSLLRSLQGHLQHSTFKNLTSEEHRSLMGCMKDFNMQFDDRQFYDLEYLQGLSDFRYMRTPPVYMDFRIIRTFFQHEITSLQSSLVDVATTHASIKEKGVEPSKFDIMQRMALEEVLKYLEYSIYTDFVKWGRMDFLESFGEKEYEKNINRICSIAEMNVRKINEFQEELPSGLDIPRAKTIVALLELTMEYLRNAFLLQQERNRQQQLKLKAQ